MKVSFFKDIKSVSPLKDVNALKVVEEIKSGKYKEQVSQVRLETDKKKRNELKQKLPYVTFAGVFSTRSNSNLKKSSGLACFDFDEVLDVEELKSKVNEDKYTLASFVSPSGNGLKVLVKIPLVDNNDDYKDYYVEISKHFEQYHKADEGTKDIARACYLSYDTNAFINPDSLLFTDKFLRPLPVQTEIINIPISDKNEIAERLDKWFKKRWSATNRNCNLHAYARQMNAFGVDKSTCEDYLFRYEQSDFRREEISQLIDSAYRYSNEFATRFFEDKKRVTQIKNVAIAGESIDKIKDKFTDVNQEAILNEFEKHKNQIVFEDFWYYSENEKIQLATYRFLQYLEANKIFKFFPDKESGKFDFVKTTKNFIAIFEESKIKDFVLSDLRSRGCIDAFELMANNTSYFNPNFLSMVKSIDVTFNKDDANTSYLYYKNGIVKTTKDKIELLKYSDITDLVWENQVIDRVIELNNESQGVFKTFLWKLSAENVERYYTLKSVIGYLMHSYQNEAKPKSIIFNDEMLSDDVANGGSGKGLIHKAIGKIKKIITEDGKSFDHKSQFAYQRVAKDTQIFLIDDVPKNFDFENLFSVITEGMTVEKKGQDAYQIPFKDSPKISITTNYTVKGFSPSHERRVFEVEIANYFNAEHTPQDEFGHLFFVDWDIEEWKKFDNFMIRCVQFYLKNGLVASEKVNLKERKFRNEVGLEFIEFMEARSGQFNGAPLSRKKMREEFNSEYPQLARFNTSQKFNTKVKEYCKFYNINLEENKCNGVVCFYIGGIKNGNTNNDLLVDDEEAPF